MNAPTAIPDVEALRACWHPVAFAGSIGGDPVALKLLDEPLVAWRDGSLGDSAGRGLGAGLHDPPAFTFAPSAIRGLRRGANERSGPTGQPPTGAVASRGRTGWASSNRAGRMLKAVRLEG